MSETTQCSANPGHEVTGFDKFCDECGAPTVAKTCQNGHKVYRAEAKFCWHCGVKLEIPAERIGGAK